MIVTKPGRAATAAMISVLSVGVCAFGTSSQSWFLPQEQPTDRKAILFDEYEDVRFNDEKARLDSFAIDLQQEPSAQAYMIYYGAKACRTIGEARTRGKRAKAYLTFNRGIDAARVITVDGGYRDSVAAELYVLPLGAVKPKAHPTSLKCSRR